MVNIYIKIPYFFLPNNSFLLNYINHLRKNKVEFKFINLINFFFFEYFSVHLLLLLKLVMKSNYNGQWCKINVPKQHLKIDGGKSSI